MVIYFEILIFNTLGSRPARIYGFNDSTAVLAHSRGAGGQLTRMYGFNDSTAVLASSRGAGG